MENNPFLIIVIVVLGVGASIAALVWRYQRADAMIRQWADRSGYQLISSEHCWFFRGPYWFWTSKSQMVYRVHVLDEYGTDRTGYIRLGGYFMGLWSDEVDVTWD